MSFLPECLERVLVFITSCQHMLSVSHMWAGIYRRPFSPYHVGTFTKMCCLYTVFIVSLIIFNRFENNILNTLRKIYKINTSEKERKNTENMGDNVQNKLIGYLQSITCFYHDTFQCKNKQKDNTELDVSISSFSSQYKRKIWKSELIKNMLQGRK